MKRGVNTEANVACRLLENSINSLEAASHNIDSALLLLACSKWSGKTRVAFEDFLVQAQLINDKIVDVFKNNEECLKKFFKDADNYISNNKILRDLEK